MSASWKMALALLAMSLAVADALRIIGGPTDADLNDPDVKKALKFAVDQTISHRNTTFLRKMTHAGSGKQQLVVGMMYILSATMATTNCAKGEDETKCDIHEDQRIAFYERCTFHVWENPWHGGYEVPAVQCVA
ncbi:cystatin-like isoform X2 [Conger conger]|uniref:cystatin-like isoform X2 n=1 Tax=Conger conger TaxID=82655 RepID=UPI002A59F9F9|nr:cystatin-like isoform X2 [Conger conger]